MELKEATKCELSFCRSKKFSSHLSLYFFLASAFLRNTLIGDYPKLERLLQEFLSQVALRNGMSLPEFSQR